MELDKTHKWVKKQDEDPLDDLILRIARELYPHLSIALLVYHTSEANPLLSTDYVHASIIVFEAGKKGKYKTLQGIKLPNNTVRFAKLTLMDKILNAARKTEQLVVSEVMDS